MPDPAALAQWRASRPGIADLQLDGTRVSNRNRDVAIDFGGYLKGVALDRAADILKQHGVSNALINISGNVMALGTKNGERWRVGIQHPRQPGPLATLALDDGERSAPRATISASSSLTASATATCSTRAAASRHTPRR